jgi:hypothetical protein
MFLRAILLMITFSLPLSAAQEYDGFSDNFELISHKLCSRGCGNCKQKLSAFDLLQIVQGILNNNILLLPQTQNQLAQQLQKIISEEGLGIAGTTRVVQDILNNNILLLPQFRNQLTQQLQQIINEGGLGIVGATGPAGPTGVPGNTGATGATGTNGVGGILDFADFYALMPPDNAETVAIGGAVDFPRNGPSSGSNLIVRTSDDTFNLAEIGVYQVLFQVSVTQAGQLVLTLDEGAGAQELAYTLVGRDTGTSQIVGIALVQTTVINSLLTVSNPLAGASALAITPNAGFPASPVSAHLVITRIQ